MVEARDDLPRGWRLVGGTFLLAILIHLLHEAVHMLVAKSYGVSGVMSTNTVRYTSEMSEAAIIASTAAGPALMVVRTHHSRSPRVTRSSLVPVLGHC